MSPRVVRATPVEMEKPCHLPPRVGQVREPGWGGCRDDEMSLA